VAIQKYILNTKTQKIHKEDCGSVKDIKPENKAEFFGDIMELEKNGYSPCKSCNP
jgi:methylphosphotriester-DNA--protein-cysteine methyltransferase